MLRTLKTLANSDSWKPLTASIGFFTFSDIMEKLAGFNAYLDFLGSFFTVLVSIATFIYITIKAYEGHLRIKEKKRNRNNGKLDNK